MGGHVVVAFQIVPINRSHRPVPSVASTFRDHGVPSGRHFGNRQAAAGMANENVGNSGVDRNRLHQRCNICGDLGQHGTGGDSEAILFSQSQQAPCCSIAENRHEIMGFHAFGWRLHRFPLQMISAYVSDAEPAAMLRHFVRRELHQERLRQKMIILPNVGQTVARTVLPFGSNNTNSPPSRACQSSFR